MAQVVNLRLRRKTAVRDADRAKGTEAAARSGQTQAARDLEAARTAKDARDLDAHRIERTGHEPE